MKVRQWVKVHPLQGAAARLVGFALSSHRQRNVWDWYVRRSPESRLWCVKVCENSKKLAKLGGPENLGSVSYAESMGQA
jgi:hypothetical protein